MTVTFDSNQTSRSSLSHINKKSVHLAWAFHRTINRLPSRRTISRPMGRRQHLEGFKMKSLRRQTPGLPPGLLPNRATKPSADKASPVTSWPFAQPPKTVSFTLFQGAEMSGSA